MNNLIQHAITEAVIIPAIKDRNALEKSLILDQKVVFVLYGDICSIRDIISTLHEAGKYAVVHGDLIHGLSAKDVAADFLKSCGADGVISTRTGIIRRAKELGMFAILRFFIFDSMSLNPTSKTAESANPDMVEILPGIMPRIIRQLSSTIKAPLLCGGLIQDKADVVEALNAGATAVSTTREDVWTL